MSAQCHVRGLDVAALTVLQRDFDVGLLRVGAGWREEKAYLQGASERGCAKSAWEPLGNIRAEKWK